MRRPPGNRQAGLTLVELLVSMLILGFVLSLVSEVVFQVSKIARAAEDATAQLQSRWSGGWSVAPVIANLAVPPEAPARRAFVGEPSRLNGYTTLPPTGAETGVQAFALELRRSRSDDGTELLAMSPDGEGRLSAGKVIARFPGRSEFAFADEQGTVLSFWPPVSSSPRASEAELPRTVMVRVAGSQALLASYAYAGPLARKPPPASPFGATP